jgi:hypothetical protein
MVKQTIAFVMNISANNALFCQATKYYAHLSQKIKILTTRQKYANISAF